MEKIAQKKPTFAPLYPCKFLIFTPFFPPKKFPFNPKNTFLSLLNHQIPRFKPCEIPSLDFKPFFSPIRTSVQPLKTFFLGQKTHFLPYYRPKPLFSKPQPFFRI